MKMLTSYFASIVSRINSSPCCTEGGVRFYCTNLCSLVGAYDVPDKPRSLGNTKFAIHDSASNVSRYTKITFWGREFPGPNLGVDDYTASDLTKQYRL